MKYKSCMGKKCKIPSLNKCEEAAETAQDSDNYQPIKPLFCPSCVPPGHLYFVLMKPNS